MQPTVLKRWSWCCSYIVWLCGFYYGGIHVDSCRIICFSRFSSPFIIVITSLGEERKSWSMCFSCICLFILHVLTFVLFLYLLVSEVTAAYNCCNPWSFFFFFFFFVFHSRSSFIYLFIYFISADAELFKIIIMMLFFLNLFIYLFIYHFSSKSPR